LDRPRRSSPIGFIRNPDSPAMIRAREGEW
jgi:hypothetical protein